MILYKTISEEAEVEQIIEKSKFITYIKPVETRTEAEEFIRKIKSKNKDATHNVPAMVIGDKFEIQWASDDGEPQGTSGVPIVQMLVNIGITNIVIVVTRYFGGIKLGTGGLVRAYTSSAKLGLKKAGICIVKEITSIYIKTEYSYLSKFQNMSKTESFEIGEIKYEEKIILQFLTEPENVANIIERVAGVTSGNFEILEKSVSRVTAKDVDIIK